MLDQERSTSAAHSGRNSNNATPQGTLSTYPWYGMGDPAYHQRNSATMNTQPPHQGGRPTQASQSSYEPFHTLQVDPQPAQDYIALAQAQSPSYEASQTSSNPTIPLLASSTSTGGVPIPSSFLLSITEVAAVPPPITPSTHTPPHPPAFSVGVPHYDLNIPGTNRNSLKGVDAIFEAAFLNIQGWHNYDPARAAGYDELMHIFDDALTELRKGPGNRRKANAIYHDFAARLDEAGRRRGLWSF
jgi:hypothetical protein